MEEREIDLLDLLAYILRHWKGTLVWMLIGAILLGGFSYLESALTVAEARLEIESNQEQAGEEISTEELTLAQVELELTDTLKTAVLMVIDDEQELASREQYAEISVLMDIDAYDVPRVELVYELAQDDDSDRHMLGNVYKDVLGGVGLYDWLEKQTGISSVAARELISIEVKTSVNVTGDNQNVIVGNDSMKVTIIHADKTKCTEMAQAVKEYIDTLQAQMLDTLGKHEVILISESVGSVMDTSILDKQIANKNTRLNLQNNIAKAIDAFTTEQEYYYDLLTHDEELEIKEQPSISIKYIVMGAIVFAFMYVAFWMVLYVMNGKLRASDELQSIYHIAQLGLVVQERKESKKQSIVDKWIGQLRSHGKRTFTNEQSVELAAAAVKMAVQKNELDAVCFVGCELKAGAEAVCDSLKAKLEKEQLKVMVLDNVLYDASAMEQLQTAKAVVLVEKAAVTTYREITEELDLLKRQDLLVLGGIVVE